MAQAFAGDEGWVEVAKPRPFTTEDGKTACKQSSLRRRAACRTKSRLHHRDTEKMKRKAKPSFSVSQSSITLISRNLGTSRNLKLKYIKDASVSALYTPTTGKAVVSLICCKAKLDFTSSTAGCRNKVSIMKREKWFMSSTCTRKR